MGSEVSIFTSQTAVTGSKRELSSLAQSLNTGSGGKTRRIQTNTNGTFKRIINGEQVGKAVRTEINLIIVAAQPKVSRTFYEAAYDPDAEKTLPNCWSNLGDKPETGVPDAQANSCAECPQNVAGSGNKGQGRACRFQRRIAVLVEGDETGEVYQFNVPAKSLFGKGTGNVHPFESYIRYLVNNGESPDNVVTNVCYDDDAESMELQFSPTRNITDEEYALVLAAQAGDEADRYTKLTVSQADGVTKAPKAELPPVKETKAIERSDEPEEEEEEELKAPVKRKSKAKASDEPKPSALADVIEEWGS